MKLDLSSISQVAGPMLNALPHPVFIVDENIVIQALNDASRKMIGKNAELIIRKRAGEMLHCIHASETEGGCGSSEFCNDCIVRNLTNTAFREHKTSREKAKMEIVSEKGIEKIYLSVIASPFEYNGKFYVLMLLENITELMELRKIIPICSVCNNIRNDSEYWSKVENYFTTQLDVDFSHSICPDCAKKYYPDLNVYSEGEDQE